MYKIGMILLSCLLMVSCYNQTPESYLTMGNYQNSDEGIGFDEDLEIELPRTAEPPPPPPPIFTLEKGSKIIKNGSMKFEVSQLKLAKNKIDAILNKYDGYYEQEEYSSHKNRNSYSLQLKIPNAKFDSLVNVLEEGIGKLNTKNISAKDVTEEYVDLNIRLENNLAYLNQYKEILKKAKSIKEILEVQEKIRNIEEEIDRKKGRLKFLDDKVKYSTLNLEIIKLIKSEISDKPNFIDRIVNAFNNGIQEVLNLVIEMVSLWPFIILIMLMFFGRKSIMNFYRKNTPIGKL